ncbi:hypothetical protein FNV58_01160 (plasmid) [Streptomyces sp. RLB1-9]|uniref:hypothetical protein n=1 Tax=Streptomyces sp. RLB1-9 TaxID=2594454 RepID=UPI001164513D|nr:hypothetical protein [Streptomyces sp. RLB1-9]QDN94970.1 hypothetical protein FNV58_01160 [Streptomyces sp. RLB1-9]
MSDDGHREWVAATRDAYPETFTELLIPRAFLAGHIAASQPAAPEELSLQLDHVGGTPALGNAVRAQWPVTLLRPLADYAEDCARAWSPVTWRTAHVAADALAEQVNRQLARESQ